MILEKNTTLVMVGDSITDCGRDKPLADKPGSVGNGYVKYVFGELRVKYPGEMIRIYNSGISGNTSSHLVERWDEDVLQLQPDYISIMIGVNDVWRKYNRSYMENASVEHEEYTQNVERMINKSKNLVKQIFLLTPFVCETNKEEIFRKQIDEYGQILKNLSVKHGLIFVNVQEAIDDVLKFKHPCSLANDRVHVGPSGNRIIANAFLKAIQF